MEKLDTIYIEEEIKNHQRTAQILSKLPGRRVIYIQRYGEIFNRKNQNFNLQKRRAALLLAKKYGPLIHKIKEESGVGMRENYYFSTLYNCPFDCSYCFLKGFFSSAFYTIFVNYEDFKREIEKISTPSFFFSGYDSDSLALDHLTDFSKEFIPFFANLPHFLELRTKSINNMPPFLESPLPSQNAVISYSLNPEKIIVEFEKKTPSLEKRLAALSKLSSRGWNVGIRFDPIIYHKGYKKSYKALFREVFQRIDLCKIHSVTIGAPRFFPSCYKKMWKKDKNNKILASLFENSRGIFAYQEEIEEELLAFSHQELKKYISPSKIFIYRDCS
jgi:spore photoproduct lyase